LKPILIDTGVIVAILDNTDEWHKACMRAMRQVSRPLATCEAVISESCFLLQHIPGAAEDVLANVERKIFRISFQLTDNADAVSTSMRTYRDMPASFPDACLIQMADELDTGDILTLDSNFEHYRWRKTKRFNLLIRPE